MIKTILIVWALVAAVEIVLYSIQESEKRRRAEDEERRTRTETEAEMKEERGRAVLLDILSRAYKEARRRGIKKGFGLCALSECCQRLAAGLEVPKGVAILALQQFEGLERYIEEIEGAGE